MNTTTKLATALCRFSVATLSSFEQVSVDEAYLDVTEQVEGSFEKARDYAQKIKADVKNQVGISFSVGLDQTSLSPKSLVTARNPTA